MITDPPYGVEYDPSWRARRNQSGGKLARGKVLNDDRADWREAYALFPGDIAYVWHGAMHGDVAAAGLAECGLQPRTQIIWSKQHFTLSRLTLTIEASASSPSQRSSGNSDSICGRAAPSSKTSIDRRHANSCVSLISPRHSTCRCTTRPPPTRVFSTTLQ